MRRQILHADAVDSLVWNTAWNKITPADVRIEIWVWIYYKMGVASSFVDLQDDINDQLHAQTTTP